jgi:hypothetical protein
LWQQTLESKGFRVELKQNTWDATLATLHMRRERWVWKVKWCLRKIHSII